ncbi:hypothetical protein [Pseudomonas sp. SLFW]|uniref:hypothetical protein n=2 Tax=unclassified Pseudomonas TaxID=196821 RepID=UPI0014134313|nr:hypothetical protein [Pseudomonas sp. SLFW]
MTVRRDHGTSTISYQTNVYPQQKGIHIMIMKKLTALTLASLMAIATGSAFAGSTGPTNPVDTNSNTTGPRNGSAGPNTDGTPKAGNSSTPGTKGMGSSDGNGAAGQGGGMSNGSGMGGSGGGAGGTGGSSGSK